MTSVRDTEMYGLVEIDEEDQRVINFRYEWLRAAGYSHKNAEKIADDKDIDWHFACDLLKQCKDEKLAMRVLYGS